MSMKSTTSMNVNLMFMEMTILYIIHYVRASMRASVWHDNSMAEPVSTFSMAEPASVTFWRCGSWWRRDTQQGPETQVLRAKCSNTCVVKTRRQQQKTRAVSVYRGPETQVLRAKYRGLETQVLRAKCKNTQHRRIVSDPTVRVTH
jgi:hypothetical protein